MKKRILAIVLAALLLCGTAQAEYIGSKPVSSVYLVQSQKHTCTLIAATMMLRNYASNNGLDIEAMSESAVRSAGWSSVGLSWDFTVQSVNVQVDHGISEAEDKAEYLKEALREHPEGVVIYDAHAPHAIYLFGYDEENDIFYCADTTTDVAGEAIRLEDSILKGDTQEEKIQTIDRIWVVTGIVSES